jgi:hypothetical protein
MGVWQGVAMHTLKFHPGPPCPTLLRPMGGLPLKQAYGCFRGHLTVLGMAHMQGEWPAAVFYPFRHPTPYAYAKISSICTLARSKTSTIKTHNVIKSKLFTRVEITVPLQTRFGGPPVYLERHPTACRWSHQLVCWLRVGWFPLRQFLTFF